MRREKRGFSGAKQNLRRGWFPDRWIFDLQREELTRIVAAELRPSDNVSGKALAEYQLQSLCTREDVGKSYRGQGHGSLVLV